MSASGHKLQLYGQQSVPMKLLDGRKVWITFQVCDVSVPTKSVGNFCAKGDDRYATFTTNGGFPWHEYAGEMCQTTVQIVGPSGSTGDAAGPHVSVPQLTDDEFPMRLCFPGAYAPRGDEAYIELETLSVASLPGRRVPSKYKIETHNLLHDPAMPWYDICIQSKSRDDFHRRAGPKVPLVIHFNYAVAGTQQGQPNLDFMVGTDMSKWRCLGISRLSQRQRGPVHCIIDPLMVVGARTFKKSSYSQTVSQRRKLSCVLCSQKVQ